MSDERTRNEVHFALRACVVLGVCLGIALGELGPRAWLVPVLAALLILILTVRTIRKEGR